jgi:hypothetical protein
MKVIEQIAEANGFQQSTGPKVFQQAVERKQAQTLCVESTLDPYLMWESTQTR